MVGVYLYIEMMCSDRGPKHSKNHQQQQQQQLNVKKSLPPGLVPAGAPSSKLQTSQGK